MVHELECAETAPFRWRQIAERAGLKCTYSVPGIASHDGTFYILMPCCSFSFRLDKSDNVVLPSTKVFDCNITTSKNSLSLGETRKFEAKFDSLRTPFEVCLAQPLCSHLDRCWS